MKTRTLNLLAVSVLLLGAAYPGHAETRNFAMPAIDTQRVVQGFDVPQELSMVRPARLNARHLRAWTDGRNIDQYSAEARAARPMELQVLARERFDERSTISRSPRDTLAANCSLTNRRDRVEIRPHIDIAQIKTKPASSLDFKDHWA